MKGLPCKGQGAYKIHILLMKSRAYPQPPPPRFIENLDPWFFQKSQHTPPFPYK